jgi:tetratricopeptide (TPR) repeat protein
LLENVLKAEPGLADVNFQLGAVNLADKKYPEAEAAFRRAYQLNPADTRSLMGIVEAALAQNQTDAALALLQAESAKAPSRPDVQMALGNTAIRAAKYDLALATFQKLLSQSEKGSAAQAGIYLRIGETYRRMGNNTEAIAALQKARETLPNNIALLNTLAVVLEAAGRKPEAGETYEAILKLDPNNALAMNNFAFLLAESDGDLDRALTLAQRARQMGPNVVEFSDTLGWIYLKKGMLNQSVEIFRDVVDRDPARSTYHYHLARAYYLKGDQAGALAEARTAEEKHPGDAESKQIQALIAQLGGGK